MKTRAALIRYNEWQVDEKRKVLAELFASIEALDQQDEALTVKISLEQVKAPESEVGIFGYGGFAQGAIQRRAIIGQSRAFLEDKIDAAQDDLQLAYQELKKIEIMEERRKQKVRKEQARLELSELDEIAQNRFTSRVKFGSGKSSGN